MFESKFEKVTKEFSKKYNYKILNSNSSFYYLRSDQMYLGFSLFLLSSDGPFIQLFCPLNSETRYSTIDKIPHTLSTALMIRSIDSRVNGKWVLHKSDAGYQFMFFTLIAKEVYNPSRLNEIAHSLVLELVAATSQYYKVENIQRAAEGKTALFEDSEERIKKIEEITHLLDNKTN